MPFITFISSNMLFNNLVVLPATFIVIAIKILFFMTLFVVVRATFPRYRYDQLMRLGWKIFLPTTLCILIILICIYPYLAFNVNIG